MILTTTILSRLNGFGANRWTKGNYDRIYFSAESLGFSVERYNTGHISSGDFSRWADLEGCDMELVNYYCEHTLSNSALGRINNSKIFYDLTKDKIVVQGGAKTYEADVLRARVDYLMKKAMEK